MTDAELRYRKYLESLTPDTLVFLSNYVAENVRFKDPLNDVHGVDAMTRVFQGMFDKLGHVSFRVSHMQSDGEVCFMSWEFKSSLFQRTWNFSGTSVLTFGPDGRVTEHIDYWDAATNLYEHLPIIGWLFRKLRKRVASH